MSFSNPKEPTFLYGRTSRRNLVTAMAAGIGAAGDGAFSLSGQRTAIASGGTFSRKAIPNPAQSGYAWVANHGLDPDQYQQQFDSLGAEGYRLIKLSGYTVGGQDFYASIWDMSPGPAWVGMHGLTANGYQAEFDSWVAQGFRPVDISGYERSGEAMYAAIFEQSDSPTGWMASHGTAGGDYQGLFESNVAAGFRPLRVSGFTVGGSDLFASIWVGDNGSPWAAIHGVDNAGYQAAFELRTGEGLRLVDISGYEIAGSDYYTAIFEATTSPYWISHHNLSASAYQSAFDENGAAGYALTHVAGYGVAGEHRYAAIWAIATDPTGGTVGFDAVDRIANDLLASAGIPGVSVAIAKNGRLVYAKGYGVADASTGEAMTVATRMRIASVSKPITGTAIMQLVESGMLTLDDLVFGDDGWLGNTYGDDPYSDDHLEITINHLLTHTSGGWGGRDDTMFLRTDLDQDELISWTLDTRPVRNSPGTMFAYSNFGFCLLGRIIEQATGERYEPYLQGTLLAQCGITEMQIAGDTLDERGDGEAVYDNTNANANPSELLGNSYSIPVQRMDAHGGWIATATDLLRLAVRTDALGDPGDILGADTLTTMLTGSTANNGYGCGWGVTTSGDSWGHNGRLAGTESVISRQPDGTCYAVIANGNGFDPDMLGRNMAFAIDDWGDGSPL